MKGEFEVTEYYMVKDLRDESLWGGFETLSTAKRDLLDTAKRLGRDKSEFGICKEVNIASDVFIRGDEI